MNITQQIKKILKKAYPDHTFKIHTENFPMGKSIWIYTDLIEDYNHDEFYNLHRKLRQGVSIEECEKYHQITEIQEKNKEKEEEIRLLLKDFYKDTENCFLMVKAKG